MNSIPRIRQLEVEIEKFRQTMEELRGRINTVKQLLSGPGNIYARNFRGLEFASTVPGATGILYASFGVSRRDLAAWCAERGIVAELDPFFCCV